jgi:hypothetical protein
MLPALYLDSELHVQEAQAVLSSDLQKIQDLASRYQLITVCTNLDLMPLSPSRGLGKRLYDSVSEIVRIKQFESVNLSLMSLMSVARATPVWGVVNQTALTDDGSVYAETQCGAMETQLDFAWLPPGKWAVLLNGWKSSCGVI